MWTWTKCYAWNGISYNMYKARNTVNAKAWEHEMELYIRQELDLCDKIFYNDFYPSVCVLLPSDVGESGH